MPPPWGTALLALGQAGVPVMDPRFATPTLPHLCAPHIDPQGGGLPAGGFGCRGLCFFLGGDVQG